MRTTTLLFACWALITTSGCKDDAAPTGSTDVGRGDTAAPPDRGADRAVSPDVAAPRPDVRLPPDAGHRCKAVFSTCSTFVDRTATTAARLITFKDFVYAPKCIQVKAGQVVTFRGDFTRHPVEEACGPAKPVLMHTGPTGDKTFKLAVAGLYGYFCLDHGNKVGDVMAGAIRVVP